MMKMLVATLTVACAALSASPVSATPVVETQAMRAAAAAAGCTGSWVKGITHREGSQSSGPVVATTGFYRTDNDFCAITVKQGQYYGMSTRMELWLSSNRTTAVDRGDFLYQAGPIRVPRGQCYFLTVAMWNGRGMQIVQLDIPRYIGAC